jgi:hypothetical protein
MENSEYRRDNRSIEILVHFLHTICRGDDL